MRIVLPLHFFSQRNCKLHSFCDLIGTIFCTSLLLLLQKVLKILLGFVCYVKKKDKETIDKWRSQFFFLVFLFILSFVVLVALLLFLALHSIKMLRFIFFHLKKFLFFHQETDAILIMDLSCDARRPDGGILRLLKNARCLLKLADTRAQFHCVFDIVAALRCFFQSVHYVCMCGIVVFTLQQWFPQTRPTRYSVLAVN